MPVIKFGNTIDLVSLQSLLNLIKICQDRIVIDITGTNMEEKFKRSKYASLITEKDASKLTDEVKDYMFDLQKQGMTLLLIFLLKTNDELLNATKYNMFLKRDMTFIDMALDDQDS